ncbi:MAG: UDP-N-acetylmuramoylalanine--D-glutamate ligase [Candidatus Babeliales bacterium]
MIIDSSKKIGVWGLGIVGSSAIKYFVQKGYQVQAMDQKEPKEQQREFLNSLNVPFFLQKELTEFLNYNDYILPSCGIDLRPYSEYKHKFLSELDLFGAECKIPIVAITGSVGKTTVTHLLSELLKSQGKKVFTGGNIGVGLLESIKDANAADYVVLEASSFQLERCQNFAPDLAICTNIYANHLDRHGSMEEYIKAKLAIIAHQKAGQCSLFPAQMYEQVIQQASAGIPSFFSTKEIFPLDNFHALYFLRNSKICLNYQTNIEEVFGIIEIPWVSYIENIALLASALHMLGCGIEHFTKILNQQELPEHRMEKIATIANIDFYNDSKATIPASTLAAIEKISNRPIVLFLGGISKGVNRADFVSQLKNKVRMIYCFGKEAEQLKSFCDLNNIPAFSFINLEQAFDNLCNSMNAQDQILFSPAGASYDLYTDYRERGDHFKKLVESLNFKA